MKDNLETHKIQKISNLDFYSVSYKNIGSKLKESEVRRLKIRIKGSIIPSSYKWLYDWFEMDSTCPRDIETALSGAKEGEEIEIDINSGGGDVYAGSEIYTLLKDYKGTKIVRVLGIAASAASLILCSGDKVLISPSAQIMIHNAKTWGSGDYRDFAHESDVLHGWDKSIANAYILKTGMEQKELLKLMDSEKWMTAQEALKYGFADEIMFNEGLKLVAGIQNDLLPSKVVDKVMSLISKNTDPKQSKEDILKQALAELSGSGKEENLMTDLTVTNSTGDSNETPVVDSQAANTEEIVEEVATEDISVEETVEETVVEDKGIDTVNEAVEDLVTDAVLNETVENLSTSLETGITNELEVLKLENAALKNDLSKANEVIAELRKSEAVVNQYRTDLQNEVVALGVKARGNAFNTERYNKYLNTLSIEELKEEVTAFKNEVTARFGSGDSRITSPEAEATSTATNDYASMEPAEKTDFLTDEANKYLQSDEGKGKSFREAYDTIRNKYESNKGDEQ